MKRHFSVLSAVFHINDVSFNGYEIRFCRIKANHKLQLKKTATLEMIH